jgi:O-antigen ligase
VIRVDVLPLGLPGVLRRLDFQMPWFALLPLLLIPLIGGDPSKLNHLLFATQVLLLAAGVKRPVWVVAAILLSEMTAANYMHGIGVSNRLLLAMASIPIVLPHLVTRLDIGKRWKLTIGVALAFVVGTTAINLAYSDDTYVIEFLRYVGVGMYLVVLIPAVVRDGQDLRDLGAFVLLIALISTLAAVFQHYSATQGTPVWETIPHAGAPGTSFESWEERALGFTENPIHAGNVLMMAGMFALGAVLVAPFSTNTKRMLALGLLLMAAASYFTYTRSWAIAMLPALATLALLYRGRYKREFFVLILVMAAGVWYWSDMQSTRYTLTASEDSSAAARPVLWNVGLNIAFDNAWTGVGHDSFLELSPEYVETVDDDLLSQQGARDVIGKYTPHNDLLNIWLSWGFFVLFIYAVFSIVIGKNFYETWRSAKDPLLRGLALGGLGALIGFQTNSLFHNFFDSTLTLWILAGISLALLKLAPLPPPPLRTPPESEAPTEPEPEPVRLARNAEGKWEPCGA